MRAAVRGGWTRFIAAWVNADALSNSRALSPFRRVGYNDMTYIPPGSTGANAPQGETWTLWLTKCTNRMSPHTNTDTHAHRHAHTKMCALTNSFLLGVAKGHIHVLHLKLTSSLLFLTNKTLGCWVVTWSFSYPDRSLCSIQTAAVK